MVTLFGHEIELNLWPLVLGQLNMRDVGLTETYRATQSKPMMNDQLLIGKFYAIECQQTKNRSNSTNQHKKEQWWSGLRKILLVVRLCVFIFLFALWVGSN